ncbi:MAG: hypothetical protein K2K93_07080 [Muribaculaceae bacterium]|nr:hypothetical protein [Muribaculaceae bacterium]
MNTYIFNNKDGKVDIVLFPGGYATVEGGVTFHYYTQDYLGNNRAVINGSTGAIEQTVAYYPYGGVIADLGTNLSKQQYKFGGKELLTGNGLNEYDFGARRYYSAVPAFTSIDPLCEVSRHLSPYLYCANDPVNKLDPTGMYVVEESLKEWKRNKNSIEKRRDGLQKSIKKILDTSAKKGWSEEKTAKKLGNKPERVASLNNTLATMKTIEESTQGYSLSRSEGNIGEVTLDDNIININYVDGDVSNFVHEVTHAGQFESGDISYRKDTGSALFVDIYDELQAYTAQFGYSPASLTGLNPEFSIRSLGDINRNWLAGIRNSDGLVYGDKIGISLGTISVSCYSNGFTIRSAYSSNMEIRSQIGIYNTIDFSNIFYKK